MFQKKVTLITGSSRGIGQAIAKSFAEAGTDVVINSRKASGKSHEQGKKLCDEICAMGRRAILIEADISKKEAVQQMFQEVEETFGKLDFLILNAARTPFKPFVQLLDRELRQLIDTNYLGNLYCIKAALPLLERTEGKVVFISSLGGRLYFPSYPLGSMKAAMETVVRDMAEELRNRKITVNGICGGIVKTDVLKALRWYWEEVDNIPDELLMESTEIAEVVLFLCGPASRGIRGQIVVVDRGLSNRLIVPVRKNN